MSKKNKMRIIIQCVMIFLFFLSGVSMGATGKFTIVGMGTTPDLMTIRAVECVKEADIVILTGAGDKTAWKELIARKEVWFLGHNTQVFYGVDPETLKDQAAREKAFRLDKQRREMIDRITGAAFWMRLITGNCPGKPICLWSVNSSRPVRPEKRDWWEGKTI